MLLLSYSCFAAFASATLFRVAMQQQAKGGNEECVAVHLCRRSSKAFMFVMNIIVPGPPTLSLVFVYGTEFHPDALGPPPEDPDEGDWQPFDYLIYR